MVSSNYLFFAYFGLGRRDMRTLHAFLDTGAGKNPIRTDIHPIGRKQNIDTFSHLTSLRDANGRTLQLLVVFFILNHLGNPHFLVPFILTKRFAASMIIGT